MNNTSKDSIGDTAGYEPPASKKSHAGFLILVCVLALSLAGAVYYELKQRRLEQQALAAAVEDPAENATPAVTVVHGRLAPGEATVELPGQTMALVETPVYARVDGYVRQLHVEIGQRVKKGEVMLELDTPDLDQQIQQAQATVAQSRAALAQMDALVRAAESASKLADLTASRIKTLADQGVMARQDADDKTAAADVAVANVRAAEENVRAQQSVIAANEANVRRLVEQKKYARIGAPFDGVVTARNPQASDVGTLISSGSATSAREIVRVSQTQSLRVYVNVPQNYAPLVRANIPATLSVDERPGRTYRAMVETTSASLDPASRTLETLLIVDNARGEILPGMYVKVHLPLDHAPNLLRIPAEALLIRSEGPTAAVVGASGKVHIQKLELGRDYGSEVEVTSGLSTGDALILNPTDQIHEGMTVAAKERAKT